MRIMAQKNATPSAWTRQKEVITGKQPTAVLVENAEQARAQVALIEEELAGEPLEEPVAAAETVPAVVEQPDVEGEGAVTTGKENEDVASGEPVELEESSSVNEVADAGEARERFDADGEVAEDGVVNRPEVAASKPATAKKVETTEETITGDAAPRSAPRKTLRGRSSSITAGPKDTSKPSTSKPKQAKGDSDDGVDREAIMANLHANDTKDDKVDRAATAANFKANADKLALKRPTNRGASSDRARQIRAAAPAGVHDRAAIRAALTGQARVDHAKVAKDEAEAARQREDEAELLAEQRRYRKELEAQLRKDESDRRAEEREEARQVRKEKRDWDTKRREEARKAIDAAASLKATSLADLEKIRAQNQFVERFNGMSEQTQKYDFDPTAPRGPSQTVTYTSRFVDRLSDVMDDMSVSGSLSIKAGKVGGSGKGSFVDSDKFKESDLNFYISVKVVNQTINFKDASVFNPLRSVDANNFREVYGDSFVSGFVEGGEFNALVSMKILNKAKKTDIQAEAKIALTAGTVQIEAEANVGIARANIETNTETTIQVSWSGGGHIKPMEQQWDIQSLMAAAARFPDLVADCPQRTYAILTKYDALRSFVARKPASYTPLQYENAQIYTNTLLDSFVSYKSLYKRLGEQIFGVQGKTLDIIPWSDADKEKVSAYSTAVTRMGSKSENGLYPFTEVDSKFEASIKGLSDARTAIRRQMARIVNEVDGIEKDPKLATDEDHTEPYQSPVAFEARVPVAEVPESLRVKSHPLSGKRIAAKSLSEEEQQKQIEEEDNAIEGQAVYTDAEKPKLDPDEIAALDKLLLANPALGADFRASIAVGASMKGELFNNLDFLKPDWNVRSIRTEMAGGALVYLAISYENGLLVEKGSSRGKDKRFGPFIGAERINSASIEYGRPKSKDKDSFPTQVLGLRLFTNRGRSLIARAAKSEVGEGGIVTRDGVAYEDVRVQYVDMPFNSGTIKGFFGRSVDGPDSKIYRLGLIWSRASKLTADEAEARFSEGIDVIDSEDFAELQKSQNTSAKSLQDKLSASQKVGSFYSRCSNEHTDLLQALEDSRNRITELEKVRESAPTFEAQCGSFSARNFGWRQGENSSTRCAVQFPCRYPSAPKLLYGLNCIDAERGRARALSICHHEVNAGGFNVQAASWSGCFGYEIGCSWLTLPSDMHLETGMVYTASAGRSNSPDCEQHIWFSQAFDSPPKIAVWIQEFEWLQNDFMSIKCFATDIAPNHFRLRIESWANRKFANVRVQWVAYPAEEDGKRVKAGRNTVSRAQKEASNRAPFYGQPFKNTPKTFIAISEMDFGIDRNTRFRCSADAPNNRELEWKYGTWDDTNMDHAEVQWLAIE
ncbi:uncharacterized protein M421DRAFT_271364 [Didymella exigua CBS 183.55]|uniref:H-type lectin domain-containing protein n=1 Tax=Didymella exigua CBS 183.55 TaxID=1150837 RepID=A0A6A5RBT6_9PLEO|nr:uncharacterized protein M421DRAFT_271364 [Didymella exigua CBS 183.55]KAF1924819.1 hypothetical protein M421DRAFT_271364 [Didymella exigua CBS 183.55]